MREMGQYFASPTAYIIAAGFLLVTGLLFNSDIAFSIGRRAVDPALIPSFLSFVMVFFAPLLTMRLLAEESREGTLELLLTAPVRDSDIVLGKFFSAWFYYTILLLTTAVYQFILNSMNTRPDMAHTIGAYIGIWLYGGATLAVGLFFSALTDSQIVSAFLAMAALLLLWLGDIAGQIIADLDWANLVRNLSLQGHYSTSFAVGLVRAEDIAYYAGVIVVMLFITIKVVESRRWR